MFFLSNLLTCLLVAISPGPNIILVTTNSIVYGRRAAFSSAIGVISGVFIWFLILLFALTLLQDKEVINVIHKLSGIYLIYLAITILRKKITLNQEQQIPIGGGFFLRNLIITILNPEIAMFYSAIFIRILENNPSKINLLIYGLCFLTIESSVFFSVAYLGSLVRSKIIRYQLILRIISTTAILYYAKIVLFD